MKNANVNDPRIHVLHGRGYTAADVDAAKAEGALVLVVVQPHFGRVKPFSAYAVRDFWKVSPRTGFYADADRAEAAGRRIAARLIAGGSK